MHNFRKLNIWIDGMEITSSTYRLTKGFPEFERYGLVSQMNRSAVSIPSNIAEGTSKSSDKDFHRYLEHSLGSAFELETQLEIARKEGYIDESSYHSFHNRLLDLQKMIFGFKKKIIQPKSSE
ncbi:four helix bundle protein [Robertkochia flava]|uniref:four helix bundle protein n=1 Tax=Robertkochia flava TaxID=3447986 RepID=UPI001CCE53A6|nr:four helix bundle protein [Robertkochia marina]